MKTENIESELKRMRDRVKYHLYYLEMRELDWKTRCEDMQRHGETDSKDFVRASAKYYTFSAEVNVMRGIVADVESLIEKGELAR